MSAFALTDEARVEAWLGQGDVSTASPGKWAQLEQLVLPVSAAIEAYIGQPVQKLERFEVLDVVRRHQKKIWLEVAPVDMGETFEIREEYQGDWNNASVFEATDYHVDAAVGLVHLRYREFIGPRYGSVRVQYTAGYGADLDEVEAAEPRLVQAATLWMTEIWRRRESFTKSSRNVGRTQAAVVWDAELKKMPEVVMGLLAPLRRLRMT